AAAVVEQARARAHVARELAEVRELRPRHRERRQVVEVRPRGPVEGLLVAASLELAGERLLVALQQGVVVGGAEVLAELALLAPGVEVEVRRGGHAATIDAPPSAPAPAARFA